MNYPNAREARTLLGMMPYRPSSSFDAKDALCNVFAMEYGYLHHAFQKSRVLDPRSQTVFADFHRVQIISPKENPCDIKYYTTDNQVQCSELPKHITFCQNWHLKIKRLRAWQMSGCMLTNLNTHRNCRGKGKFGGARLKAVEQLPHHHILIENSIRGRIKTLWTTAPILLCRVFETHVFLIWTNLWARALSSFINISFFEGNRQSSPNIHNRK